MESEERALPEQETPAAEAESPLPAAAAPAESGEGQAPAEGWGEQAPARQAAINDVRAKEHLAPVGGGQAAEDGLTDEIIRNYRQYNPRWTRAQIAAFHRSYKQGV